MLVHGIKNATVVAAQSDPRKHLSSTQLHKARTVWKQIFDVFDVDKDGFLTPEEISSMLATIGDDLPEADLSRVLKTMDSSLDGTVDFDEFFAFAISSSFEVRAM